MRAAALLHAAGVLKAALLVAVLSACGRTVPHGGVPKQPTPTVAAAPRVTTVSKATDLIPADLDLVVRVDLAKVRADLGEAASLELMAEALESSGVRGVAREALADADVVWLGLRLSDLERGDHVMVATRTAAPKKTPAGQHRGIVAPSADVWTKSATKVEFIARYVAKTPASRADTARIYTVRNKAAVFVSPVEEHSVERVIASGPDPLRGDPTARGLLSMDLRDPRLSASLTTQVPALAKLVASVTRVRATADIFGDDIELEGTISCRDAASAAKVAQYLSTFTTPESRFAELLAGAKIDKSGASVFVRWRVPRELISRLIQLHQEQP